MTWRGVLGFTVGVIFVISLKVLIIGQQHIHRRLLIENRHDYLEDMTSPAVGFTYRHDLLLWISDNAKICQSESEFLHATSPVLCFIIEYDTNQIPYIETALLTFAKSCDRMLIFHTSISLSTQLLTSSPKLSLETATFHFISGSNSTMQVLIETLSKLSSHYAWFTYVPHSVYLLPANLEYYLAASLANPDAAWFIGKDVHSWKGPLVLSNGAPLVMSRGAIRRAAAWVNLHPDLEITNFPELIRGCQGTVHELVSLDKRELFLDHKVHEYYMLSVNPESKLPVFPVSLYVGANQYKPMLDLHYYISKLNPYGLSSRQGHLGRQLPHDEPTV